MESRFWSGAFTFFLGAACVVLAVLVLLLARENRRLKAEIARPPAGQVPADALRAGDCVAPFDLVGDAGEKVRFDFEAPGQQTLLLVFSRDCPACSQTLPLWNQLLAEGLPPHVRVVAVDTDRSAPASGSAAEFSPLAAPIFGAGDPRPELLRRVPWVPVTAVLSSGGMVSKLWFGVPNADQLRELRVTLMQPGEPAADRCRGA